MTDESFTNMHPIKNNGENLIREDTLSSIEYQVFRLTEWTEKQMLEVSTRLSFASGHGAMEFMAYGAWLKRLRYPVVTASIEANIVGWSMTCEYYRGVKNVAMVYVDQNHRRQGIGTELISLMKRDSTDHLQHLEENTEIIRFYKRLGIQKKIIEIEPNNVFAEKIKKSHRR